MPIDISMVGSNITITFPPDVSNAPVCIDTSSPDVTIVTIPPPSDNRPPISIGVGGDGAMVTIQDEGPVESPPISIPDGGQVIIEFPTGGSIVFPIGQPKPVIMVKNGRLVSGRRLFDLFKKNTPIL